ncbi:hypothetical protein Vretimale_1518, partial [Volvox reticuliferus]
TKIRLSRRLLHRVFSSCLRNHYIALWSRFINPFTCARSGRAPAAAGLAASYPPPASSTAVVPPERPAPQPTYLAAPTAADATGNGSLAFEKSGAIKKEGYGHGGRQGCSQNGRQLLGDQGEGFVQEEDARVSQDIS